MAARIDSGRAQLLTRTGLDWTAKYPSVIAALANANVKAAYLDGELCGVDESRPPSFCETRTPRLMPRLGVGSITDFQASPLRGGTGVCMSAACVSRGCFAGAVRRLRKTRRCKDGNMIDRSMPANLLQEFRRLCRPMGC
jgi:hypothetical protein